MSTNFLDLACPGIRDLKPYQPGKPIEELEREYGITDIIKLASNENPLGPGSMAIQAIKESAEDVWLYPDGNAFALKAALTNKHNVDADQITIGNGSNDVLELAARVFLQPGTNAVFAKHSFAVYPLATMAAGAQPIVTPVFDETSSQPYVIDFDAMLDAINEQTRMVFVANPNNPTGTWADSATLYDFIKRVPENVVIVIDEAYTEYVDNPDYPNADKWVNEFQNLIVTRTFSKAYGLAGLRIGYGLSSPELADLINRVRQPFNVSLVAQMAALAALEDREHLLKSHELNTKGMRQLEAGFSRLGLEYIPSVGNFVCVKVGAESASIYEGLLRSGVIVRPVDNYGLGEYLRVTVGLPEQNERFLVSLEDLIG